MKDTLDNYIQKEWSRVVSKLSKPIVPRTSFFSQEAAQLVFILLIFIVVSDTSNVIYFSQSLMGHISAVLLILYFTVIHPMVGAIFSMAMILYYHSDLVKAYYYETFLFQNTPSTLQEGWANIQEQEEMDDQYIEDSSTHSNTNTNTNTESFRNMEASTINSAYPFTTDIQTISSKYSPWFRPMFFNEHEVREGFGTRYETSQEQEPIANTSSYSQYQPTYEQPIDNPPPYSVRQSPVSHDTLDEATTEAERNALFRQTHCSASGHLMHKHSAVKPSMAEFIFPELQIEGAEDGHPCNPCSPGCKIHVSKIDQRLNTERILQQRNQPSLKKTSNDWVPSWFDIFLPHPVFEMAKIPSSQPFAKPANKTITF